MTFGSKRRAPDDGKPRVKRTQPMDEQSGPLRPNMEKDALSSFLVDDGQIHQHGVNASEDPFPTTIQGTTTILT